MKYINEPNKIILKDESGHMVAAVTFPDVTDKSVNIEHTFVDPPLRGQGIASNLMNEMVKQLRQTGKKAYPVCDYAASWFEKHPEHQDLLIKRTE